MKKKHQFLYKCGSCPIKVDLNKDFRTKVAPHLIFIEKYNDKGEVVSKVFCSNKCFRSYKKLIKNEKRRKIY